ncbi:F-box/kelch-repeat protein At1g15670-like [Wolffia australiana]
MIPGLPDEISRECLARVPPRIIPAARQVSEQWRTEIESPQFHHLRRANGLARPIVALAQINRPGKSISFSITLYDPISGEWAAAPPVPGGRLPIFCQLAAVGRELVVLGGWDPATWTATNEVFIFDLAAHAWRRGAPIPFPPRSFFACAAAPPDRRRVYIAGGHDEEKRSLKSAMVYDLETDAWSELPDMAAERDEGCGVFRGGEFIVVGGYGTESQGGFSWSAEAFDPAAARWAAAAAAGGKSPAGGGGGAVVSGGDGRLFRCLDGQIEVLEASSWRKVVELPEDGEGKKAIAPRLVILPGEKEKLMVIGSARRGQASFDVFSLELGPEAEAAPRWLPAAPPPEKLSGAVHSACCLEI